MPRYPLIHRLLHWAVAVIVLWQAGVGLIFMVLEFEGTLASFGQDWTNFLYTYHKSFGIVVLGLMLARLGVRLAVGRPDYRPPLTTLERRLSGAVHFGLYAALIAQPVVGWAATAAGGFPIEFFGWVLPGFLSKDEGLGETLYGLHGAIGAIIVLLALLHVAGALRHWLVLRDRVMTRMSLP
ncbi:MAG TPA: cytochrome b [Paracoccaceae bacterium]|nr:cytochrome b [Paracoccaceae bacterium]